MNLWVKAPDQPCGLKDFEQRTDWSSFSHSSVILSPSPAALISLQGSCKTLRSKISSIYERVKRPCTSFECGDQHEEGCAPCPNRVLT